MANSVDPDQTAPIGAVCSGSMLFASILNLSVMLGNFLQQTTSADDIFRCIFCLGALRDNVHPRNDAVFFSLSSGSLASLLLFYILKRADLSSLSDTHHKGFVARKPVLGFFSRSSSSLASLLLFYILKRADLSSLSDTHHLGLVLRKPVLGVFSRSSSSLASLLLFHI